MVRRGRSSPRSHSGQGPTIMIEKFQIYITKSA